MGHFIYTAKKTQRGFTLLEVLVAMSIFAVIGLGASQMLRTIITTHERVMTKIDDFSGFTKAFTVLERDLAQVVVRPVRDEYGDLLPPLMVATGPYLLEMSRTGWNNPAALPRSNLQRVAYELNDEGELKRYFWLVLDRAEDSEPIVQTLLTNVEDFRVNVISHEGDTTDNWPNSSAETPLPAAAEIYLVTETLGEVRKVFVFSEALMQLDKNENTNPGSGRSDTASSEKRVRRTPGS